MVEQEAVAAVIAFLDEWFQAIEDGTANQRMPDPQGKRYSEQEVDALIETIDVYILGQIKSYPCYWEKVGLQTRAKVIDAPADFNRLEGVAREAFAQAVYERIEEVFRSVEPVEALVQQPAVAREYGY